MSNDKITAQLSSTAFICSIPSYLDKEYSYRELKFYSENYWCIALTLYAAHFITSQRKHNKTNCPYSSISTQKDRILWVTSNIIYTYIHIQIKERVMGWMINFKSSLTENWSAMTGEASRVPGIICHCLNSPLKPLDMLPLLQENGRWYSSNK